MSVYDAAEIHNGRDGDDEVAQRKGVSRYTRVFRVTTTANTDAAAVVLAAMPRLGAVYPGNPRAFLLRRRARNESFSKRVWIVTLAYSTEKELQEDPLADPAETEWNTEQFQRPVFKNKAGQGILNSAGDPPDPPAQRDDSRITAVTNKNLPTVPAWILAYRDAVNDAAFVLDGIAIPKGIAKMQAVRVSKWQERNDIRFRVVTMTMHFADTDDVDWPITFLDQGFREKIAGKLFNIKNDPPPNGDGEEVTAPVPLDGNGVKLANPTPANAVFNDEYVYDLLDFSVLPLT